jgi:hypothetical protein
MPWLATRRSRGPRCTALAAPPPPTHKRPPPRRRPNLSGSDEVELEDVKLAESRRAQVFYSLDGRSSGPITFAPVGGEWKVVYEANPAVVREREYLERKQRKLESKANGH